MVRSGYVLRRWLEHNGRLWSRPLVVVGVLGASAFVAPRASLVHVALLLGVICLLVLIRWPSLGVMALVPGGMLFPFSIGTGTGSRLNVVFLLLPVLLGLWLLEMLMRRDGRISASWAISPLLALSVVAILAFIAGTEPWMAFADTASLPSQMGGLAIFLLSASAFLVTANQIRDVRWLRWLTWLFLGLGALYLGGRLLPVVSSVTAGLFQRGMDGSMFWVWLVALSGSQALFNNRLPGIARLALAALVAAAFYVTLTQGRDWISGWLPPLVALLAILWSGAPRAGLVTSVCGGVVALVNSAAVADLLTAGDNLYSLDTRMAAWRVLEQVIAVSPVLGLGPANYYRYTPLLSLDGFNVSFSSHNNYVDIVAQTGFLGLACLAWFFFVAARRGWRLRNLRRTGFRHGYVCGALGGLAGTLTAAMLGDWVLPFVYNVGFDGFRASVLAWIFLGGLAVIEQTTEEV